MSQLILNEVGTPSTPASTKGAIWLSNDATPLPKFIDDSGGARLIKTVYLTTTGSDFTGANVNTAQPVFNTTEDSLTIPGLTTYILEASYHIHTTGATSHTFAIGFGGTATLTSIGYQVACTNAATEVLGAAQTIWVISAASTVLTAATATATHHSVYIEGLVRVNAGGTFIPQYTWSAAPGVASVTLANSFLKLIPVGANTMTAVGPWA